MESQYNCVSRGKERVRYTIVAIILLAAIGVILHVSCCPTMVDEHSVTRVITVSPDLMVESTPPTTASPVVASTLPSGVITPTLSATASAPSRESNPDPITIVLNRDSSMVAAAVYPDAQSVVLIAQTGQIARMLRFRGTVPLYVTWSPDGCTLRILVADGEERYLYIVDLEGHVLRSYPVDDYTSPTLSPEEEWLAGLVYSGKRYYDHAEFQDVDTVRCSDRGRVFRLTKRGGASAASVTWSPDGAWLSYSDYDEDGYVQLYRSHPDGSEQQQLTTFSDPHLRIGAVRWSSTDGRLAFSTVYPDGRGDIWIVSPGEYATRIEVGSAVQSDRLWWGPGGQIIIAGASGYRATDGLYWLDIKSNRVCHVLHESEVSVALGCIIFPFPVRGSKLIGFVGGDHNYYEYDVDSQVTKLWIKHHDIFPDTSDGVVLLRQLNHPTSGPVSANLCASR